MYSICFYKVYKKSIKKTWIIKIYKYNDIRKLGYLLIRYLIFYKEKYFIYLLNKVKMRKVKITQEIKMLQEKKHLNSRQFAKLEEFYKQFFFSNILKR